jgi:hypothetical protein
MSTRPSPIVIPLMGETGKAIFCFIECYKIFGRDVEVRRAKEAALAGKWLERRLARPRLGEAQPRAVLTCARKHEV